MQIDLPDSVIAEATRMAAAGAGENAAAVIAFAIEKMNADSMAIQEGIDAYKAGDFEPLEDFDRRYREKHGIAPRT